MEDGEYFAKKNHSSETKNIDEIKVLPVWQVFSNMCASLHFKQSKS